MSPTFDRLKTELLRIDAALQGVTENQVHQAPDKIHHAHLKGLNRLAAASVRNEVVEDLMRDPDLQSAIGRISRLKRLNGLRLEDQFASSLLDASDPQAHLLRFVYYPNYVALARMEYEGAGLHGGDQVVFLGSGPLPMTLICLFTGHGIEGVGIEQDDARAELSRAVIGKLGMDAHIEIICGDHFDLPIEMPCDLIMVGADAMPKTEIFAHLAGILEPGRMVSYRIYEKGLRRLFDDGSRFELPSSFRECARVRPEPPVNNTCVVAVRTDDLPPA
ncbi:MAG: nicotianamine synthase family protein [Deltaproteobacteria bacterium]|nr:nicotianamine synthase family protein [Deltaproteobacteria bacterium]